MFSCWGMIAYDYKGPLIFYNYTELGLGRNEKEREVKFGGPMTQERYCAEILPFVKAQKERYETGGGTSKKQRRHFIFQEDGDGSHGNASAENPAREMKDAMNLDYIDDWPPHSPDLNLIENVWRIIKSRVKKHKAKTAEELRAAIEKE